MRIGSILTLPSLTYLVDIGKIEEKLDLTSYSHRDSNLYSLVQSSISKWQLGSNLNLLTLSSLSYLVIIGKTRYVREGRVGTLPILIEIQTCTL